MNQISDRNELLTHSNFWVKISEIKLQISWIVLRRSKLIFKHLWTVLDICWDTSQADAFIYPERWIKCHDRLPYFDIWIAAASNIYSQLLEFPLRFTTVYILRHKRFSLINAWTAVISRFSFSVCRARMRLWISIHEQMFNFYSCTFACEAAFGFSYWHRI